MYSLADFRQLQFTNMCATLWKYDRSESFGSYRIKALGRLCHEIIDVDQSSVMKSVLPCPCMWSLASSGLQNGGSMLQCCKFWISADSWKSLQPSSEVIPLAINHFEITVFLLELQKWPDDLVLKDSSIQSNEWFQGQRVWSYGCRCSRVWPWEMKRRVKPFQQIDRHVLHELWTEELYIYIYIL